jgi:hypothetical protein
MTSDRLGALLHDLPVPQSEPALERTVTAARERVAARRRTRRRTFVTGLVLLAGAAVASPVGQAAIQGVGELVGLVGDPPSLAPQFKEKSRAMIVHTGHAPDGSGYEWVAGLSTGVGDFAQSQFSPAQLCLGLDWPGHSKRSRHFGCSPPGDDRGSFGLHPVQAKEEKVDRPDLMVSGETAAEVHDVRVLYTDASGEQRELPTDFKRIDGELLERTGGKRPFGVYIAFLTAEQAARDGLPERIDVSPSFRADRALPPVKEPRECRNEPDPRPAPFEVVMRNRDGEVVENLLTTYVRLPSAACNKAWQEQDERP